MTQYGNWLLRFKGEGGLVQIKDTADGRVLSENPGSTTTTQASMVSSVACMGDLDITFTVRTGKQLLPAPEPYQTAWVCWHLADNSHFYYFTLKTNGWEFGKEDPAYRGMQRFIDSGDNPKAAINGPFVKIRVQQHGNHIAIDVGPFHREWDDGERPYLTGHLGLYNEDAEVEFSSVKGTYAVGAEPTGLTQAARAAVPAYFDPAPFGPDWSELCSPNDHPAVLVVINPDSGPGSDIQRKAYLEQVKKIHDRGGAVLYYIHTYDNYDNLTAKKRLPSEIGQELDAYYSTFRNKVDGVFFDQVSDKNDTFVNTYLFYKECSDMARAKYSIVMFNPGAPFALNEQFLKEGVADLICIEENDFTLLPGDMPFLQSFRDKTCYLIYHYPASEVPNLSTHMGEWLKNVGWVFVTDHPAGAETDPWGSGLPSTPLWQGQLSFFKKYNE